MRPVDQIAKDLFDKIRNTQKITGMKDADFEDVKPDDFDPSQIRVIFFELDVKGKRFGIVKVDFSDEERIQVMFDENTVDRLTSGERKQWQDFLAGIKEFAVRNGKRFDIVNADQSPGIRDMAMSTSNELNVMEGTMFGTSRSSFQSIGPVKMIVRHYAPVDETKFAARARHIQSIFLETPNGERFKVKENNLTVARILGRHLANGGMMTDSFVGNVYNILHEVRSLRYFVITNRNKTFEDATTNDMVEAARAYYRNLRETMRSLLTQRGYKKFLDEMSKVTTEAETTAPDANLKDRFVQKSFNDRLETAMPAVHKAYTQRVRESAKVASLVKPYLERIRGFNLTEDDKVIFGTTQFVDNSSLLRSVLENIATKLQESDADVSTFAKTAAATLATMFKENQSMAIQLAQAYLRELKNSSLVEEKPLNEGYEGKVLEILKNHGIHAWFDKGEVVVHSPDDADSATTILKNSPEILRVPTVAIMGNPEGDLGLDDEDYLPPGTDSLGNELEEDDENNELENGGFARDSQDGPRGEVFRVTGYEPGARRCRIDDKNGRGWYISPSRLVPVFDEGDIIQWFPNHAGDDEEMDLSIAEDGKMPPAKKDWSKHFKDKIDKQNKKIPPVGKDEEFDDDDPHRQNKAVSQVNEAGGFNFSNENDAEIARNFGGLVKSNNGLFKSAKQAAFLKRKYGWDIAGPSDPKWGGGFRDDVKKFFGIDLQPGQKAISADGYVRWADYGSKSVRPVTWYYVVDDLGVVAKYKLGYKGSMRGGTSPDPAKTKLEWKRPDNVDTSALQGDMKNHSDEKAKQDAANAATAAAGSHLGSEKDRVRGTTATIEGVWGPKEGAYGSYYINRLRDDAGKALLYFGNALGQKGDKLSLSFTVKKHDKDSRTGEPVTIINRPKIFKTPDQMKEALTQPINVAAIRSELLAKKKALQDIMMTRGKVDPMVRAEVTRKMAAINGEMQKHGIAESRMQNWEQQEQAKEAVRSSITRRLMYNHQDLFGKYSIEDIEAAVDEEAYNVASFGLEEIGSSDITAWVHNVIRHLTQHVKPKPEHMHEAFSSPPPFNDMVKAGFPDFKPGDKVRTRKAIHHGVFEKFQEDKGINYAYFRVADGRLLRTPHGNLIHDR